MMMRSACEATRARLSRFADRELSAKAAEEVAGHLLRCPACRWEFEQIEALRLALRTELPDDTVEAARQRVFARVERSLNSRTAPQTRRGLWNGWRPAVAAVLAAGVVTGLAFLMPGTTPEIALPDPSGGEPELQALLRWHDSLAGGITHDDPIVHRDAQAEAHAALLERDGFEDL